LQKVTEPAGFHTGMLGSVLLRGQSRKDLDLVLYPHHSEALDRTRLDEALVSFGLKRLADRAKVTRIWRDFGSSDNKHVEVWQWGKKRVDFFFLK
jgi:hypothetical protein